MDYKELMIGDWCAYGVNCKGRVTALTDHLITLSVDGNEINGLYMLMPDMVNPIPLTEEILVNNGFEKFAESQTQFDYTDNDIHLEYWIGDGCFRYYTAEIHYVHQLQHLLRLCGINKEIEL